MKPYLFISLFILTLVSVPTLINSQERKRKLGDFSARTERYHRRDIAKMNQQEKDAALLEAAEEGEIELVQLLISGGARVDYGDDSGITPLMIAAANGHLPVVRLLISSGVQIDKTNKDRKTAFILACVNGKTDIAQELLQHGANINATDIFRGTALIYAALLNDVGTSRLLIEKGALVNLADNSGETALSLAARNKNKELVELLIKNGADPYHRVAFKTIYDEYKIVREAVAEKSISPFKAEFAIRKGGIEKGIYLLPPEILELIKEYVASPNRYNPMRDLSQPNINPNWR